MRYPPMCVGTPGLLDSAGVAFPVLVFARGAQPEGFDAVGVSGGVLLLWIAVRLVFDNHEPGEVKAQPNVWGAVATIMIADGVMSLDNVLAIVGVAEGHLGLIVFGLVLSIPLVVFGAGAVLKLIDRWPIIVWAGAALLGWVAGEMIATDPWIANWLDRHGDPPDVAAAITGAVVVLAVAGAIKLARRKKAA